MVGKTDGEREREVDRQSCMHTCVGGTTFLFDVAFCISMCAPLANVACSSWPGIRLCSNCELQGMWASVRHIGSNEKLKDISSQCSSEANRNI